MTFSAVLYQDATLWFTRRRAGLFCTVLVCSALRRTMEPYAQHRNSLCCHSESHCTFTVNNPTQQLQPGGRRWFSSVNLSYCRVTDEKRGGEGRSLYTKLSRKCLLFEIQKCFPWISSLAFMSHFKYKKLEYFPLTSRSNSSAMIIWSNKLSCPSVWEFTTTQGRYLVQKANVGPAVSARLHKEMRSNVLFTPEGENSLCVGVGVHHPSLHVWLYRCVHGQKLGEWLIL